jgi:transcriptional regulator GlxA family with amidase domain
LCNTQQIDAPGRARTALSGSDFGLAAEGTLLNSSPFTLYKMCLAALKEQFPKVDEISSVNRLCVGSPAGPAADHSALAD